MSAELVAEIAERSAARSGTALLQALRPRQWTKNLLLFAGIVFAAKLGDPTRWAEAVAAFGAWCAASSAAYLVNDVRDRELDRAHPLKRARPIARGDLSVRTALVCAAVLVVTALTICLVLDPVVASLVVAFLAVQGAYTSLLKHLVFLDVLAIAGLFVIRATAGRLQSRSRIPVAASARRSWRRSSHSESGMGGFVLVGSSPRRRPAGAPCLHGDAARPAPARRCGGHRRRRAHTAYTLATHDSRRAAGERASSASVSSASLSRPARRGAGEEARPGAVTDRPILAAVEGSRPSPALRCSPSRRARAKTREGIPRPFMTLSPGGHGPRTHGRGRRGCQRGTR